MTSDSQGKIFLRKAQSIVLVLILMLALFGSANTASGEKASRLIYFDGHMHTVRSDGSGTIAQIKQTAISRGLNAVVITDHCKALTREEWASLVAEATAASDSNFLVLPGVEITGDDGIFNRAHMLAYAVKDPFVGDDAQELCPEEVWPEPVNPAGTGPLYPENLTKWADYIHSQGGIAVHNHPSGSTQLSYGVNSIEVYNQSHVDDVAGYAAALGYPPEQARQLGLTLNNFALYGERDANLPITLPGFPTPVSLRYGLWYATSYFIPPYIGQWLGAPEAPLRSWDELLMAYVAGEVDEPIFALANSDSHNTGDPGSTVGLAKNGVYVEELTANEIYKAIKAGRSFATTGPSLNLMVNDRLMGSTAKVSNGTAKINLSVNAGDQNALLVKVDILKNGSVWKTAAPLAPSYNVTLTDNLVTEDGYYRVEVTSYDPSSGKYSFAWSNPIFVKIH